MNCILLSIGDELALGQTIDTNAAYLSQQLAAVGCGAVEHVTVGDDQPAIEHVIRRCFGRCDVLLITGGLGPTSDDLTRQALAAVLGVELRTDPIWRAELDRFFKDRGRAMPASNAIQAMIPRGAKMIFNTAGTAAGIEAIYDGTSANISADKSTGASTTAAPSVAPTTVATAPAPSAPARAPAPATHAVPHVAPSARAGATKHRPSSSDAPPLRIFAMPGVPKEMKAMFARDVLPAITSAGGGAAIRSTLLHTFGLGESWVAESLGDLMTRGRNPSVGTTISGGVVSLRINSRFATPNQAQQQLDATVAACRQKLGDIVYGQGDDTLAGRVARQLTDATRSVATAESCTGGLLATMLTDIAGSSAFFKQGWITYSNDAKISQLGVLPETIATDGAVSEAVALAMASGARERAGADYAVSITGIAGPGGGSADKPVGTVWIALATRDGPAARLFNFPGDRAMVRDRSAKMALSMLRFELLGRPLPW